MNQDKEINAHDGQRGSRAAAPAAGRVSTVRPAGMHRPASVPHSNRDDLEVHPPVAGKVTFRVAEPDDESGQEEVDL